MHSISSIRSIINPYFYLSSRFIFSLFILFIFVSMLLFSCILVFNRIKHPFWAIQPVFHYYDLHYWGRNKGILSSQLPDKNKFVNFQKVQTMCVTDENLQKCASMWNKVLECVQTHYLRETTCEYVPSLQNIVPYFVGHAFPCFISTFVEPEYIAPNFNNEKDKVVTQKDKVVGVMTSRPLYVCINTSSIQFPVYYIDYLCVDKTRRKQNVAPQLIQTHEYVQSHQSRKISVSLFKREGELTGIVPLTTFNTVCFSLKHLSVSTKPNPVSYVRVSSTNILILYDFLKLQTLNKQKWDIFILPHLSNIMECIKTDNIIAYMSILHDQIQSCYFFRTTQTSIIQTNENEPNEPNEPNLILSCFASVRNPEMCNVDDFISGFYKTLAELLRSAGQSQTTPPNKNKLKSISNPKQIGYLSIENISDNADLIKTLCETITPYATSPTAYFFYNFGHSPFSSTRSFILS